MLDRERRDKSTGFTIYAKYGERTPVVDLRAIGTAASLTTAIPTWTFVKVALKGGYTYDGLKDLIISGDLP